MSYSKYIYFTKGMPAIGECFETLLDNSGGTNHIVAQGAADYVIHKRFQKEGIKIDAYSGVSSGVLTNLTTAVHSVDYMERTVSNIDLTVALGKKWHKSHPLIWRFFKPFHKGRPTFTALVRFIFGGYLVLQDVRPIMKKIITRKDHQRYINGNRPPFFTTTYDQRYGRLLMWNLKSITDYDKFHDIINAAVAAQKLCKPTVIQYEYNGKLYDGLHVEGGQADHSAGHQLISRYKPKHYISVFSRPETWKLKYKDIKTGIDSFLRAEEADLLFKSVEDEIAARVACEKIGAKPLFVFCNERLSQPYSTDETEIDKSVNSTVGDARYKLDQFFR